MDPLNQFQIKTYIPLSFLGIDLSFTNASLFMVLSVGLFCVLSLLATRSCSLVPTKMQSLVENTYTFLNTLLKEFCGEGGLKYFPYIFSLFIFVFFSNMVGLIPGAFTSTSQLVVTGTLALIVFISVTAIGLLKHGFKFFRLFLPDGVPFYVIPILVPVEILSYFMRPVSLSIRLFANMVAGHVMLKIFASFAVMIAGTSFLPLSIVPLIVNTAVTFFEVVVALLQAYVFTILSCIYLNDALNLH
ncbi:MAG TPA: F0F1 ATP synthase subunit A [Holosporales bacterium]|nr:F0F1 ATP synthase subunit A [Holosporales bacterium]